VAVAGIVVAPAARAREGLMAEPETIPDNSRIVAALRELLTAGKPLYGSYRGRRTERKSQ
jgi:hypothetical protein